ncbi:MAG: GGDEF domain-containing protein [Alphaproteobacteria bacterium]
MGKKQEEQYLDIFQVYNSFAYEWNLYSDHIRWPTSAHLLFGDVTLYDSGDYFTGRLDIEDFATRIEQMHLQSTNDHKFSCEYDLIVQGMKTVRVREEGHFVLNKNGLPGMCRGRIFPLSSPAQSDETLDDLKQLASLTKLPSKAMLLMKLQEMLDGKAGEEIKAAFVQLKIDKVPLIGLLFGLEKVKEITEKMEALLIKCVRGTDVVGQISPNSFGIILQNCGQQEIVIVAKRLVEFIEQSDIKPPQAQQPVKASIGGTVIMPQDNASPEDIFHRAERALLDTQHIKKMATPTAYVANQMGAAEKKSGRRSSDAGKASTNKAATKGS